MARFEEGAGEQTIYEPYSVVIGLDAKLWKDTPLITIMKLEFRVGN